MKLAVEPVPAVHRWTRRGAAGALAAAAAWWVWRERGAEAAATPWTGRPLPAFSLPRLDDLSQQLSTAQMRGTPWLLNLWASWCAPCRDEHPTLVALARDHDIALVGLLHQDDPRAADEWLRRLGNPYRAVAVDRDGTLARALAIEGVPQTLLIDAAGVVLRHLGGPLTHERWSRELQPLLSRGRGSAQ